MHWHHRPFAHPRDADALLGVIRMRPAAARLDPLTLAEMQELLQLPRTGSRIHVWLRSDDTLLGYAYLNPSNYLFFETIDVPHRAMLEVEMIHWGEAQLQRTAQATNQPLVLATTCAETNHERSAVLTTHGFGLQPHGTVDMRRSLHGAIPQPILPSSLTIRAVAGDHEVGDLVALHQAAFQTQYLTVADRLGMMHAPGYDLNRDLVVVAPDDTLVAYCTCWVSTEENEGTDERVGYTDPIATHPDVQGQGVGRALLIASCQLLADQAIDWACLSTSSQNTAMLRLAKSVGFSIERTTLFFEKSLMSYGE
jgi:ribosomal protein S18 acetylase RimI-like enzyme